MSTNEEVLQELPNEAVRKALVEIIENVIPVKSYSLQIEQGSSKGDNYIGVVHRVGVTYKREDKGDTAPTQHLGIFVKVPPDNPLRREQFFARPSFLREALIYNEYLPLIVEFQHNKGIIPEENGFQEFAKCYRSLTNNLEEAVFMEDLRLKGFIMNSRFESPTLDLVKLVMRSLGKLHAVSFALNDQWPDRFAKFRGLEEIFAHKKSDDQFVDYLNAQKELALGSFSCDGDEEYLQRVDGFFKSSAFFDRMLDLLDGSKAEPYAIVCHGDCWINNILFKYENAKPVAARLVDWQFARYASPVTDLMYFIFCCTTKSLRDDHYEGILNEYYSALEAFIKRLGSDPTVLFPRTALDDQLKRFGAFALIIGLMAMPTIMTKAEDVPDLDEISTKMDACDEEYIKQEIQQNLLISGARIRDVIIDLIQLGYL